MPADSIFKTRIPINFYFTVIIISIFFLFFLVLVIIERLEVWGAVVCFLSFSTIVCIHFGRYLAEVRLSKSKIEVFYLYPWNKSEIFSFNKLVEIDSRDKPFLASFNSWYSGFQWLFLKNEKGQILQIRYNINRKDNEFLLKTLRSM